MGLRTPGLVLASAARWPDGPAIPTCHPDRKHQAKGFCSPCYRRTYQRERTATDPAYVDARRRLGREYVARHPDKPRRDWLRLAYGIAPIDLAAMLDRKSVV